MKSFSTVRTSGFSLLMAMVLGVALVACGGSSAPATTATAPAATAPMAAPTATAAAAATAFSGGPSSVFKISGLVGTSADIKLADLQVYPKAKVTTDAQAGGGTLGMHEYGGALLYDIVQKAQPKLDANKKNDQLRKSAVVTDSDGYSAAFAWGEFDSRFGAKQVLVAWEQDGKPLPEKDGFVRLIAPGDIAAGRYVSNIVKIEVKDVGTVPAVSDRKVAPSFALAGLVTQAGDFDAAKLGAMKQTDVTVERKDANGVVTAKQVFSGVLVSDFLQATGVKLDTARKNDIARLGVLGIATDGYSSLVTGGEVDAKFGNVQVVIALKQDGQPIPAADGFARIIVPGDIAAGRFVSNLVRLEVVRLD